MKTEVKVPSVGESVTRGVITAWVKQDGQTVNEGDILCELETDKTTLEVPAPAAGVLQIQVEEETEVEIGQVLGVIVSEDEQEQKKPAAPKEPAATENKAQAIPEPKTPKPQPEAAAPKPEAKPEPEAAGPKVSAPPPDLPQAPPAPAERRTERVPMSAIRRKTAERLVQAQHTAAYLTTFNEIDMQNVIDIRAHYKDDFEREHGIKIGFMSFFVKACCQALKEYPGLNAQLDGGDILYQHFYDIGVAISIEEGLLVPVIRDADRLHFAQIESAIDDLARRAKTKKIRVEELTGGTFTITNGGVFGSMLSTPIPAYPQTAILGMHAIKKRPVVVEDKIVVRPIMYVALSYDHRVIDGRQAIGFLMAVKNYIEEPDKLLLEL